MSKNLICRTVGDETAVVEADDAVAVFADVGHAVADKDECGAAGEKAVDALLALAGEVGVAHGHDLVDEENLGLDGGGDAEAEARKHAGGVLVDGGIDEGADVGEVDDVVHQTLHFLAGLSLKDTVEDDVLAPGEFGAKACTEGEHHRDAAMDADNAGIAAVDAADDGKQRRFATTVMTDKTDFLAAADGKIDIVQGGEPLDGGAVTNVLRQVEDDVLEAVVAALDGEAHRQITQFNDGCHMEHSLHHLGEARFEALEDIAPDNEDR